MSVKPRYRAAWIAILIFSLGAFILTVIAIPRCRQMLEKSKEGASKGNLGTLKSAASIYYGDTEGIWPPDLEKDLVPKYLKEIPTIHLEKYGHLPSKRVENYPFLDKKGKVDINKLRDTGHWLYDSSTGTITIDCTHRDNTGKPICGFDFE